MGEAGRVGGLELTASLSLPHAGQDPGQDHFRNRPRWCAGPFAQKQECPLPVWPAPGPQVDPWSEAMGHVQEAIKPRREPSSTRLPGCLGDSRQRQAQSPKCGISGRATLAAQWGGGDQTGHIKGHRPARPLCSSWLSGSRLLPSSLDRQSVTNGQNVRLIESKH